MLWLAWNTQSKYFPTIKRILLDDGKKETATISMVIDRIHQRYSPMKVKIVVGQKLFKRKAQEIKATIERSTHFV